MTCEICGLTGCTLGVADPLAAHGFIAVVPDPESGLGPGGRSGDRIESRDGS